MNATTQQDTPRVWIGNLHAYNDGRLIGEWVDADDLDTLQEAAARVIKAGGGEEFALFDREYFGDLIGEYTQLERVAEIGAALVEHGDPFRIYYTAEPHGIEEEDVADLVERFEERYQGEADSLRDYAEWNGAELLFGGEIPDEFAPYIDWSAVENALSETYWYADGYVFSSY